MHLNNRSILTAGDFKITSDARIDTDHKENKASGIRSDYQYADLTLKGDTDGLKPLIEHSLFDLFTNNMKHVELSPL